MMQAFLVIWGLLMSLVAVLAFVDMVLVLSRASIDAIVCLLSLLIMTVAWGLAGVYASVERVLEQVKAARKKAEEDA